MESLRATEPLRLHGIVLIPVQRVRIERSQRWGVVRVHAFAEPRAIVVQEGGGCRAFDLDGVELALEPLLGEVTGLANALERERSDSARAPLLPPEP